MGKEQLLEDGMFELLLNRIRGKRVEVGIIGLRYVGLPLAREWLR